MWSRRACLLATMTTPVLFQGEVKCFMQTLEVINVELQFNSREIIRFGPSLFEKLKDHNQFDLYLHDATVFLNANLRPSFIVIIIIFGDSLDKLDIGTRTTETP